MMRKPHTLPTGEVMDVHQGMFNIPKPFHKHWLYGKLPRWQNVLYYRESADVWDFMTLYFNDLVAMRRRYGSINAHKYVEVCHDKIFKSIGRADMPILLYKLWCHVQYFDLAIEMGKRDFSMRREFNNEFVWTWQDFETDIAEGAAKRKRQKAKTIKLKDSIAS